MKLHPFNKTKLFSRLFGLVVLCVGTSVFAGIDGDGIPDVDDPYPMVPVLAPYIYSPYEGEEVFHPDREVTFSGSAEVGSEVKIFDEDDTVTPICSSTATGNGISLGRLVGDEIDSLELINEDVQDQFFYDTLQDSSAMQSSGWRESSVASWFTETKDDEADGICDYRLGDGDGDLRGGVDARCSYSYFPEKALILATTTNVYIFDAHGRAFWKKFQFPSITTVHAFNGKIYVGTSTGIEILDFAGDDFTQDIVLPQVGGIDTTHIVGTGTTYVLGVGGAQVLIRNELAGTDVVKNITGGMTGSFLSDDRVMFVTATTSEVSDQTVDALVSDFSTQTIQPAVGVDSGAVNVATQNFIGTTAGLARIFMEAGNAFVQFITDTTFTLPVRGDVRGNFTGFLDGSDIKNFVENGSNLENINSVDIAAVSGNPELYRMQFDGMTNYVRSGGTGFEVSGNQLTVGMWVRRPTVGGVGPYKKILVHGRPSPVAGESMNTLNYWISAGDNFFDYPIAEDPYFFGVRTENGQRAAQVDTLEMDTWQFLVGTYDGSEIRFYLDGVIPTGDDSLPIVAHAGNMLDEVWTEELRMGAGFDWEYFDGAIALPFISATTYTPAQVQFLYNLSLPWFTDNTSQTLAGTGSNVLDVSWDDIRSEAAVATETTITNLKTDGETSSLLVTTGLKNIARTYLAPWSCSYQFATSGIYTVFGRTVWNAVDTVIESLGRTFAIYPTDNDSDGDGLNNDVDNDPNVPILNPIIYAPAEGSTQYHSLITFSGRAEADTDVQVFLRTETGDQFLCASPVGPLIENMEGAWSCDGPDPFVDGPYVVFARAYVGINASNRDSADRNFTVFTENPNAPILLTLPEYSNTNTLPIMWTDPNDPLMNVYWAEKDTVSTFDSATLENSTWAHASHWNADDLVEGETYFFRVKTHSAEELDSIWSEIESTSIDLTSPVAGGVDGDGGRYSLSETISFSWNTTSFTDSFSGITYFQVRVETDVPVECGGAGGDTLFTSELDTGEDKLVATTTGDLTGVSGETYTACVRAVDAAGNSSEWIKSLPTTVDTTAPGEFSLQTLSDPSPNTTQVLQWERAIDAESEVVSYEVLFQDAAIGTPTLTDPWISRGMVDPIDCGPSRCEFTDTGLVDAHSYRYKVVATNGAGQVLDSANFADVGIDSTTSLKSTFINSSHYTILDNINLEWTAATDIAPLVDYDVVRNGTSWSTEAGPTATDSDAKNNGEIFVYTVQGQDGLGGTGAVSDPHRVLVDKAAAITTATMVPAEVGGWYGNTVEVTLSATDPGDTLFDPSLDQTGAINVFSGIKEIRYQLDGAPEEVYTGEPIQITTEGAHTVDFYSIDRAGNIEITQTENIQIDFSTPLIELIPDNFDSTIWNGFSSEVDLQFHVTANDGPGSGIATRKVFVRFDENGDGFLTGNDFDFADKEIAIPDSSVQTFTFDTDGAGDGRYDFYAEVMDAVGNRVETPLLTVKVDRKAPIVRDDIQDVMTEPFTIHLEGFDQGAVNSGVVTTYFTTDDSDPKTSLTVQIGTRVQSDEFVPGEIDSNGYFTVKYYAVDALGNESGVWTARYGTDTESEPDCSGVPSDEMPDWWENLYAGLDPVVCDGDGDLDSDGLSNKDEFKNFTNPTEPDTDGDGILDGVEVTDMTAPLDAGDHRFILIAPQNPTTTLFSLLGTATPYATISTLGETATIDPSGTFVLSVEMVETGPQTLSFLHPRTKTAVSGSSFTVTIQADAENPKILNFDRDTTLFPNIQTIEILAAPNARLWIFEMREGAAYFLAEGKSDGMGAAEIEVSFANDIKSFFVFDATNLLTSTHMKLAPQVFIRGKITTTTGEPISVASVQFTADDGHIYSLTTDIDGNFEIEVPTQTMFGGRFWQRSYQLAERSAQVEEESIYMVIQLELLANQNYIQTADGQVYVGSTGEHKTLAWSGRDREEEPVVRLTMAQSREQIAKMNEGFKGSARTIISSAGKEIFGGYLPGRISVWQFTTERVPVLGMTAFSKAQQQEYLSSARAEGCLELKDSVMDFKDVARRSPYFEDLLKMRNLGFLKPEDDNKIRPEDTMEWGEALEMIMKRSCIEIDTFKTLVQDRLPQMEHIKLSSDPQAKLFYTALKSGLLATDYDPKIVMTRGAAVKLILRGFGLTVSDEARQSSFVDVDTEDDIAPYVVLAKKMGMFQHFTSSKFKTDQEITRAEFASFFVALFENERETKDIQNIGRSRAVQNLETARRRNIDYVAAVKRKQEVNRLKQEKLFEMMDEQKADWKQVRESDRAPMWKKDNTANIRRASSRNIQRQ